MSDLKQSQNQQTAVRPPSPSRTRKSASTGPRTDEGKRTVSRNATTHGCTAIHDVKRGELTSRSQARIVLPDEDEAEWSKLLQSWREEYQPETELALDLVTRAAIADWMMRRTLRRYDDVEQRLFQQEPDATLWTAEQHSLLDRFLRYRVIAERSFYRSRASADQLRRSQHRFTKPAPPNTAHPSGQASPPASAPPSPTSSLKGSGSLIQCITVQVIDGQTFTLFQPKSDNLRLMIAGAEEPKPTVKRALYFMHGIPDEYSWIAGYEDHEGRAHYVIERTCDEALKDLEHERLDGSGHVLPAESLR